MKQPKDYLSNIEKPYHAFLTICNVHASLLGQDKPIMEQPIGSAISGKKNGMNLR